MTTRFVLANITSSLLVAPPSFHQTLGASALHDLLRTRIVVVVAKVVVTQALLRPELHQQAAPNISELYLQGILRAVRSASAWLVMTFPLGAPVGFVRRFCIPDRSGKEDLFQGPYLGRRWDLGMSTWAVLQLVS